VLFIRGKKRGVEVTDAGSVFAEEAKSSIFHLERAVTRGQAAHEGRDSALNVGYSPNADHDWIAAILGIQLPSYPRLKIRLTSQFSMAAVRGVLMGELDFALVTAPPQDDRITAVPFARTPLYAALPETHPAAHTERLVLQDLANDPWILFPQLHDPIVHQAIMETARRQLIFPKNAHDIITAHQAVDLVAEHVGVAIFTKPPPRDFHAEGVVIRPLCDPTLSFETFVVMRASDDCRLVNAVVRSFLRKYPPQRLPPQQLELHLAA